MPESPVHTLTSPEAVSAAVQEAAQAARLYYTDGTSPLSDEQFDAKVELLKQAEAAFPDLFTPGTLGHQVLHKVGAQTRSATVRHRHPMLSLAKMKTTEELRRFLQRARQAGASAFRLQGKMDGLAVSVTYQDGTVTAAASRGDGHTGEDCSHLLDPSCGVRVLNLPASVPVPGQLEVRGELMMALPQLEQVNQLRAGAGEPAMKNARNAAAGLVNRSRKGLGYSKPVPLLLVPYSVLVDGQPADLEVAASAGFQTVDALTRRIAGFPVDNLVSDEEVLEAVDRFRGRMEGQPLAMDGVVVKPVNEAQMLESMGSTEHHPLSQAAWKYPAAQALSTVTSVEVTVGRTGRVTPVAVLTPTELDGSVVSRASLHSFRQLWDKDVRVGSVVVFEKANMVIPHVVAVVSSPIDAVRVPVPSSCPACSGPLVSQDGQWPPRTLTCPSTLCPARAFNTVLNAVKRPALDIEGLGPAVLEALNDAGAVSTVADLFRLDLDTLASLQTGVNGAVFGVSRARKVLAQVEQARHLPLHRVLVALGVPGTGAGSAKAVTAALPTIDALMAATVDQVAQVDGFSLKRASSLVEGLKAQAGVVEEMKAAGVEFRPSRTEGGALSGVLVCASGKVPPPFTSRPQLAQWVEEQGGSFTPSPREGALMVADPAGTSAKLSRARALGLRVISPQEFYEQIYLPAAQGA